MLRLMIFVSILSLVYGLVNIESQPAKVAYGNYVKFVCDVGTMENNVKWVYGGVTYFSCDPPYSNCYTNFKDTIDDYYDFSIKDNSIIMILQVSQNKTDGIWSCYHGKERDNFKLDIKDQAWITSFSIPRKDTSGEYKIQCKVQSQLPVDVTIYAPSYKGRRILYDVKQSSLSNHSVSSTMGYSEGYIYCNVTNGYGPTASRVGYVYEKCPLKILHDLFPDTVSLNDTTPSLILKIYFEGYPLPSSSLYKVGADDIPDENGLYLYPFTNYPTNTEPASVKIFSNTNYYNKVKPGKYMLILKQGNIKESKKFNLIYSTTTTTTTTLPTETSTIDVTTTTHQAPDINTVVSENKIMIYLGVAGFVMFLMLILILVIVGVFWFIRMKRKPAASVDQNQVYSTMQNPSNGPNPIYENLKKL